MAESSGFHTTDVAPAGHQVTEYTEALMALAMEIIAACHGDDGVAPDYLNELEPTDGGANTVDVDTGAGLVEGFWYYNSASEAVTINSAPGGTTRFDRVELIHTGTPTFTVELTVNEGDAVNPPAATAGGITVCTVEVDDAGAVTVTDARDFAYISNSKIINRTRKLFVPALHNTTSARADVGVLLADGAADSANGFFTAPADFVSTCTVKAIVHPAGTGNLYCRNYADYGAAGESAGTHSADTGTSAVAVTNGQYSEVQSVSLASLAAGDYVILTFYRTGGDVLDTVGANVYITGFLVSYTADS